ncbi:hypothetical protein ABIA16_002497 [Sinorhizobium fredii]
MQAMEAIPCARKALLAQQGVVQPFRKIGNARQRRFDRFSQRPRREAGGQSVNWFDERQAFGFGRADHVVRVHHRSASIEPVHLAADDHSLVDRQGFFQPVSLDPEEGESQFARIVVKEDAIGDVRPAARGWLVPVHAAGYGDDRSLWRIGDAGLPAPVDQRVGRVEEEIDDAAVVDRLASEQARVELAGPGADAGQAIERRKQRIKQGRAHDHEIATRNPALARLTSRFPAFIEPVNRIRRCGG